MDKIMTLLFASTALFFAGSFVLVCYKALILAKEADAEIAELKRIIAEKDAEIAELGQALEDAQRFIG